MINQIILNGAELKLSFELRNINNKYPYLNDGGCPYIAKWIGDAFIKHGINVQYLILDNISDELSYIKDDFKKYANVESLSDLAERMIEVSHVLPLIDNRLYIDSKGVFTSFESTSWSQLTQLGFINHKTLNGWVKDKNYYWNPLFMNKHGHQLYSIEKEIKSLIKSLYM